jgi:hypothetical protein
MQSRAAKWHPGGGEWRPPVDAAATAGAPPPVPPRGFGPTTNRTMNAREAAHRLWPDLVGADPKDDKTPAKTPNQVMDDVLKAGRRKNQINTTRPDGTPARDPLQ